MQQELEQVDEVDVERQRSEIGRHPPDGLIAYDTQRLKATYYELGADQAVRRVATNFGALTLYINFINLFQFLLHFMGQRR